MPFKQVSLVVGGDRRYEWVIALRAVETIDFMTSRWMHLPYELLLKVSNRVINQLKGGRVTYDVSSKPPATIEWGSFSAALGGAKTTRAIEWFFL